MGRGVANRTVPAAALIWGRQPRRRRGDEAVEKGRLRISIPITPHPDFRPIFRRLGLEAYVPAGAENGGFVGGAKWQALGRLPAPWTAFKSAREMTSANTELQRRKRMTFERAHGNSGTLLCELADVEAAADRRNRRKVFFGTEWSGSSIDADHFEAMAQVILAGGRDIHETRYLTTPRTVICLDEDGRFVGWCQCRRDAP